MGPEADADKTQPRSMISEKEWESLPRSAVQRLIGLQTCFIHFFTLANFLELKGFD